MNVAHKVLTVTASLLAVFTALSAPIRSNLGGENTEYVGEVTYTASDYVQAGLIAMWDGIENAGWGIHDDSAAAWYDLINNIPITYSGAWEENCYCLNGSYQKIVCPSELSALVSSGKLAYEFVCTSRFEDRYGGGFGFDNAFSGIAAYGSGDNQRQMLLFYGFGISAWIISPQIYGENPLVTIFASVSIDVDVGVKSRIGFLKADGDEAWLVRTPRACTSDSTVSKEFGICSRKIYAIRIYDRPLTNEEMEYNHNIDKERFGL